MSDGVEQREPPLTDEQRAVVDVDADAFLVVTAGAGAGKTHTMIRRLGRLLAEADLHPHEMLVLTFARSAVRELRDRLVRTDQAGRLIRVRTFDSWAFDLLMEFDGDRDWQRTTFDDRIAAATALLRSGTADQRLDDIQHLVIDEAQDLVGVRMEMVTALIEHSDCAFTVVGDAAQSIYGFQIGPPEERARGADAFFRWLRSRFDDELTELELGRNFRARTEEARTALRFGPELRIAAENGLGSAERYEDLRTSLLHVLHLGDLDDEFVHADLRAGSGTTAILCRTNGEVLAASERLAHGAVPHRVQRTAQNRVAPAWIAGLFRDHDGSVLTRTAFDDLLGELSLPPHHDPLTIWGLLLRTAGDRGRRSVEMERLRRAVAEQRLPDEITAQPPADLVVSTFHRAKGLEFDRVVVMDPGPLRADDETTREEEARLLYVAMTRARDELMRIDSLRSRQVHPDPRVGRYARFGRQRWQRFGMEIEGEDVHSAEPAGTTGFHAEPRLVQERLLSNVELGDEAVLERLLPMSVEESMSPPYVILHRGTPVAVTSVCFRRALYRILVGGRKDYEPSNYPGRISETRIDAIETVVGSPASGSLAGLGDRGVWLAPRLIGLSRFAFDRRGDDA